MNDISYYFVGLATGIVICIISWSFGIIMEKQNALSQLSVNSEESEQK